MSKILVAISGASGVNLGVKLANEIAKTSECHVIISHNAKLVLSKEEEILLEDNNKSSELYQIYKNLKNTAKIYDDSDISASLASGSFGIKASIIAPCSINTLAKIHAGFADTLITRAAAVALKERRKLILGVREMPFSTLALEQMARLSSMGVIIAPPVLGYYADIKSVEDMENFIIGKWLDALGIENQIYKRWGKE
ncbi:UbiX family flavin prenyltransferase [Campylobacter sp. CCUG 57310]|uniref:UbiX family flavin prenyltransferase n=1 Tax=Campylobacter sp. CCUG 57310 TaxID=2517362 RepID=UPI0015644B12|nr:UbiX family flavin prenyltransferase [Campylobacter sp. CCUG 57310]QKF92223.1 3-octaprenyl-4-hydroxybenzoate carboxy-lyase [Campylobacter sp. CCUG 57310]